MSVKMLATFIAAHILIMWIAELVMFASGQANVSIYSDDTDDTDLLLILLGTPVALSILDAVFSPVILAYMWIAKRIEAPALWKASAGFAGTLAIPCVIAASRGANVVDVLTNLWLLSIAITAGVAVFVMVRFSTWYSLEGPESQTQR